MALYSFLDDQLAAVEETTFSTEGKSERGDLQRLLRDSIQVLSQAAPNLDLFVLDEEFSNWDDSKRRIDLLAIDREANLVVIELKRTHDGDYMDLQALRYAAMVGTMTFEQAVEAHESYRTRRGMDGDAQDAILDFLGWDEPSEDDFANDVKLVLASGGFGKELTSTVLWLNDRQLDITCIELKLYKVNQQLFLEARQTVPLPEASEYQVQVRSKGQLGRVEKAQQESAKAQFYRSWWQRTFDALAAYGETFANGRTATKDNWYDFSIGIGGVRTNLAWGRDELRVEIWLDADKETNKDRFDRIHALEAKMEEAFPDDEIRWRRMDDSKASQIALVAEGSSSKAMKDDEFAEQMMEWSIDRLVRLRAFVNEITAEANL